MEDQVDLVKFDLEEVAGLMLRVAMKQKLLRGPALLKVTRHTVVRSIVRSSGNRARVFRITAELLGFDIPDNDYGKFNLASGGELTVYLYMAQKGWPDEAALAAERARWDEEEELPELPEEVAAAVKAEWTPPPTEAEEAAAAAAAAEGSAPTPETPAGS